MDGTLSGNKNNRITLFSDPILEERDLLFANFLDMLGVAGCDGQFKKLNTEFERMLGWTNGELVSRSLLDIVHPDDLLITKTQLEKMAFGNANICFENRCLCKNGSYKWLAWRTTGTNDGLSYFVARDITDQKMAAQSLRKSTEMQAALAELSRLALKKADLVKVFAHALRLSTKVLDLEFSALYELFPDQSGLQLVICDGWPGPCPDRTLADYTLNSGGTVTTEDFYSEERFQYESNVHTNMARGGIAVTIPKQEKCYGILALHSSRVRDYSLKEINFLEGIANVLASAVERRHLETQLKTSDRLASVGALAAAVAHEVNNPLSYVITNLDLLSQSLEDKDKLANSAQLARIIKQAQEGAERVRSVIKDLRTFSGSSEDKLETAKLESIVDFSLRMAANQIRYHAKLTTDFKPAPSVLVSENRLGQVILNLLINAAQAIPEGQADQNEIKVTLDTDASGRAVIEVTDTGAGIAPEILPRVFDPFFTTKPVGVGTGLGLSICRNIISNLKGDLTIESRVGYGTKVRITLPPSGDPDAVQAAKRIETELFDPHVQRKILILDDEAPLVESMGQALGAEHIVHTTTSPSHALGSIAQNMLDEPYDIILCDLMMAEMTGMDFFATLKRTHPGTEANIIFMTGGTFTEQARVFLETVPNLRIEKPFSLREIRNLLKQPLITLRKNGND